MTNIINSKETTLLTIFNQPVLAFFLFLSTFEVLVMGIFKTRKNKKYTFEPRYYKNDKEGSPFKIERKFDQYRKATGDSSGLKSKFSNAWDDFRNNSDSKTNKTILIIIAILILIFLFIIDFDLSIFKKPL